MIKNNSAILNKKSQTKSELDIATMNETESLEAKPSPLITFDNKVNCIDIKSIIQSNKTFKPKVNSHRCQSSKSIISDSHSSLNRTFNQFNSLSPIISGCRDKKKLTKCPSIISLDYNSENEKLNRTDIHNKIGPDDEDDEIDESTSVRVLCRFRPLIQKENELNYGQSTDIVYLSNKQLKIMTQKGEYKYYTFDRVFDQDAPQSDIFELGAKPIVDSVFEGFNGTVFVYGQTGSGKTHTMLGSNDIFEYSGIIPRTIDYIFDYILSSSADIEYTVKLSIMEIYKEKVRDLIDTSNSNLNIRDNKSKGIVIEDLSEHYIVNEDEFNELIKISTANRSVGITDMNEQSSRSHYVVILTLHQENYKNFSAKSGKLFLVDLAGSEKISKTHATGLTLEEAKTINKSLSALGIVINALTNERCSYIPYRESKLTRILSESLGGNSKTSLIITCSPSLFNCAETLSTLRFGTRAKKIKNKPKINKEETLDELKLIIERLEKQLAWSNHRIQSLEKLLQENNIALPQNLSDISNDMNHREFKKDLQDGNFVYSPSFYVKNENDLFFDSHSIFTEMNIETREHSDSNNKAPHSSFLKKTHEYSDFVKSEMKEFPELEKKFKMLIMKYSEISKEKLELENTKNELFNQLETANEVNSRLINESENRKKYLSKDLKTSEYQLALNVDFKYDFEYNILFTNENQQECNVEITEMDDSYVVAQNRLNGEVYISTINEFLSSCRIAKSLCHFPLENHDNKISNIADEIINPIGISQSVIDGNVIYSARDSSGTTTIIQGIIKTNEKHSSRTSLLKRVNELSLQYSNASIDFLMGYPDSFSIISNYFIIARIPYIEEKPIQLSRNLILKSHLNEYSQVNKNTILVEKQINGEKLYFELNSDAMIYPRSSLILPSIEFDTDLEFFYENTQEDMTLDTINNEALLTKENRDYIHEAVDQSFKNICSYIRLTTASEKKLSVFNFEHSSIDNSNISETCLVFSILKLKRNADLLTYKAVCFSLIRSPLKLLEIENLNSMTLIEVSKPKSNLFIESSYAIEYYSPNLISHREEKERLRTELSQLRFKNSCFDNELNEKRKLVSKLQSDLNNFKLKVDLLDQNLDDDKRDLIRKIVLNERAISQLNKLFHQALTQKDSLKDEIDNLKEKLNIGEETLVVYKHQNLELKTILKSKNEVIETLQRNLSRLNPIKKVIKGGKNKKPLLDKEISSRQIHNKLVLFNKPKDDQIYNT